MTTYSVPYSGIDTPTNESEGIAMNEKPTLIVASHRAVSNSDAAALEKQIEDRNPAYNVIVIPQATGVVVLQPESPTESAVAVESE